MRVRCKVTPDRARPEALKKPADRVVQTFLNLGRPGGHVKVRPPDFITLAVADTGAARGFYADGLEQLLRAAGLQP